MSLNIQDLDIFEDLRDVFNEVSQGKIYFITEETAQSNPFSSSQTKKAPKIIGETDFISFEDATEQSRWEFSETDSGTHRCKIVYPSFELSEGLYVFLSFSGGIKRISGILKSFQIGISSIIDLQIDAKENVPFPWFSWLNVEGAELNISTNSLQTDN